MRRNIKRAVTGVIFHWVFGSLRQRLISLRISLIRTLWYSCFLLVRAWEVYRSAICPLHRLDFLLADLFWFGDGGDKICRPSLRQDPLGRHGVFIQLPMPRRFRIRLVENGLAEKGIVLRQDGYFGILRRVIRHFPFLLAS